MSYALPIKEPKTKKEGLLNFVQMIINAAERGDTREAILLAILLAVDLKDTLDGEANPYSHLVDGFTKDAVVKEVTAARSELEAQIATKVQAAYAQGAADYRKGLITFMQGAAD